VSKDNENKPSGRSGLPLAPLSFEEVVVALLEVEPDPPRNRRQKASKVATDVMPKERLAFHLHHAL
jgi:hypothetical protein